MHYYIIFLKTEDLDTFVANITKNREIKILLIENNYFESKVSICSLRAMDPASIPFEFNVPILKIKKIGTTDDIDSYRERTYKNRKLIIVIGVLFTAVAILLSVLAVQNYRSYR